MIVGSFRLHIRWSADGGSDCHTQTDSTYENPVRGPFLAILPTTNVILHGPVLGSLDPIERMVCPEMSKRFICEVYAVASHIYFK